MIKNLFGIGAVALAALFLAGCNTIQGIGKDLERGGQAIEKAAR